jgi:ferredoxin/flavodoxin---NADP+ reductase
MARALVAVVGSGPAGFYTAATLLRSEEPEVHVDMIEKLPTPWGLVRSGVAPDHPKIKTVSAAFARTAEHERFRFCGNVEIGRDVTRAELLERYDAVVYSIGAQSDNRLGIPGDDLPGSMASTAFVGWYNGHPEFRDLDPDLNVDRAVVIGAGNVALDVARMLVTDVDELATTDTADHALDVLRASKVKEVVIVARRGPLQASFTTPELRELPDISDVDIVLDPADFADIDPEDITAGGHTVRTNMEALHRILADHPPTGKPRRMVFRFARSPLALHPGPDGRVAAVELACNDLVADESGTVRARDNGQREILEAGLVVRAVGYRALPLPDVPFDDKRAVIPNDGGRVIGGEREYVAGWIKRGPSGVIGTNRKDGQQTAEAVLADLVEAGVDRAEADIEAVHEFLRERSSQLVTQEHWRNIDEVEVAAGKPAGRPRAKLCTVEELLAAARG